MNFVNVGDGAGLNTGVAPVLASAFSEVFQVYSAKKFPGVIESTPLSKCFATQGASFYTSSRTPPPSNLSNWGYRHQDSHKKGQSRWRTIVLLRNLF